MLPESTANMDKASLIIATGIRFSSLRLQNQASKYTAGTKVSAPATPTILAVCLSDIDLQEDGVAPSTKQVNADYLDQIAKSWKI